jgi:hypothetical protein
MRRKKRPIFPSFEKFTANFLEALNNYYAEPLIPFILEDEDRGKRCAALLWSCVNGSAAHLTGTSVKWTTYWDSEFKAAIRGIDAMLNICANLKPLRHAKSMEELRGELLERRGKLMTLPSKEMGRDHNWAFVLRAKENLESLLCQPLTYATLAALLNAAYEASGQAQRSYSSAAISSALKRLSRRLA